MDTNRNAGPEFAEDGFGRNAVGQSRPLTPQERVRAMRTAALRDESVEKTVVRLRREAGTR